MKPIAFGLASFLGFQLALANECYRIYSSPGKSERNLPETKGQARQSIDGLLKISEIEWSIAKSKISQASEAKPEEQTTAQRKFQRDIEALQITEDQAQSWIRELVREKVLFGEIHEVLFLKALNSNLIGTFNDRTVGQMEKDYFAHLPKIYSSSSGTPDYAMMKKHIEGQIELLKKDFDPVQWEQLNEEEKNQHAQAHNLKYKHHTLKREKYEKQIKLFASILSHGAQGEKFLEMLFERTGHAMSELVVRQNKASSRIAIKSLLGWGGLVAVGSGLGPTIDITSMVTIGAGMSSLATGTIPEMIGLSDPKLEKLSGLWRKRKAIKKIQSEGTSFIKIEKEAMAEKAVKSLEIAGFDFGTSLFKMRQEIQLNLAAQPTLISLYGQYYSSGFSEVLSRIESFEQRYAYIVGDSGHVLGRLREEKLSLEKVKANLQLNQVSKDSLYRLLLEVQNLRTDVAAMAMMLDGYLSKLDSLDQLPNFSTENMRFIVQQRRDILQSEIQNLSSFAMVVQKQNAILLRDIEVLSQIEQIISKERLSRLTKN